jgi:hypothetical protein
LPIEGDISPEPINVTVPDGRSEFCIIFSRPGDQARG